MRLAISAVLAVFLFAAAAAAQPPKPPAPLSIDELIAKLVEHRKAKTDASKAEAAIAAELKARLAEITDKLRELGILGPDVPPTPPPNPPQPDVLAKKLKDAIAADAGKREDVLSLAALYRQAAKLAADASVPSSVELLRRVREASATLIGPGALPTLRNVVAAELLAALGTPSDSVFTTAQRKAVEDLFTRLAVILEA